MLTFIYINLALVLFVSVYRALIQYETHFQYSRIFLLASGLIAILFPLLDFQAFTPQDKIYAVTLPEITVIPVGTETATPWTTYLVWVYLAGASFFLMRLLWNFASYFSTLRKATPLPELGIGVYESPEDHSFSFLKSIYIEPGLSKEDQRAIFLHESIHREAGHSYDRLLAEVICLLCWFNPFAWIYRQSVAELHEFIADEHVIESGQEARDYQYLLVSKAIGVPKHQLVQQFINQSLLKKRITMINKEKSTTFTRLKYVVVAPLALALIIAVACTKEDSASTESVPTAVEVGVASADGQVYKKVDQSPTYGNGTEDLITFLGSAIKYPKEAEASGAVGTTFVQFVVNTDGSLSDTQVLKSAGNELLDAEALRAINSMDAWNPGVQADKEVRVQLVLPIRFALD